MSSLPATPSRSRSSYQGHFFTPINKRTAESRLSYSAPVSQVMAEHPQRGRRDRDSTISASDVEEAVTDEDIAFIKELLQKNIELEIRQVPTDEKQKVSSLITN